jgi:ABC-type Fe3+-hydroxamate transport system substrate-binding protein
VNVDWAGVAHAPASSPRIACLVPSLTELLFALDLGAQVVARTGFCFHPRDGVRRVPKVGGTKDPDLARLRALAPTHLVVNIDENRQHVVDAARAFVPHVVVTHPAHPADNARLYALFGAIFERAAQAAALARELAVSLEAVTEAGRQLPRERVVYLIWRGPWMTVAPATYVGASLAMAGWDVVPEAPLQRYPVLADDDRAWRDADRLLVSTEPYAFRARDAQALSKRWGKPAHLIDGEWTSWYGARAIPGLRALGRFREEIAG